MRRARCRSNGRLVGWQIALRSCPFRILRHLPPVSSGLGIFGIIRSTGIRNGCKSPFAITDCCRHRELWEPGQPADHSAGRTHKISAERSFMTQFEKILFTGKVRTTGGRDGVSRSDDGRLEVKLSTPRTSGSGTNPEQLLAAGWSASVIAAMKIAAGKMKITLPA